MKLLLFLLIFLTGLSNSDPTLKISEIKKQNPAKGIFTTDGYIAKIYVCPPCPPDALCKPCMPDNIVISEENKTLDTFNLTEKELIIFTKDAKKFVKGKKYKFKIQITDRKSTGEPLNDIELIDYKLLK